MMIGEQRTAEYSIATIGRWNPASYREAFSWMSLESGIDSRECATFWVKSHQNVGIHTLNGKDGFVLQIKVEEK